MPTPILQDYRFGALTLADYARIIGYDECAFWGVFYDGQIEYDCRMFWTEWQRMDVLRALIEAQQLMERELGYPLSRTWVVGQPEEFGEQERVDSQDYQGRILLRYGYLIRNGVKATATLAAGSAVSYVTEPATVGPLAVSITDASEVKVFYPGTQREITPSKKVYSGGNLTLYIPRCRLTAIPNQLDDGVDYNTLANFVTTVDVIQEYNDPSVAATIVSPHSCSPGCYSAGCSESSVTGCIYPIDKRLGIVDIIPATYDNGDWVENIDCYRHFETVRLNYLAGLNTIDEAMQNALVRLAHARMAAEPCGCEIVTRLWERDHKTPEVLSAERLNCPFGLNEGAWIAYKFARTRKLMRMRSL